MTPDEIIMREALERIASYDASAKNGYVDEWELANAFDDVQDIAKNAIDSLTIVEEPVP
jgi:hypothetical protein